MNCPNCNAHNPDGADFCSLCLTSFRAPVAPPPAADPAPSTGDAAAPTGVTDREVAGGAATGSARSGRIRRTEEGFDWQCDRCQSWSPLEVTRCVVCQRDFRTAVTGEEPESGLHDVDPRVALALTVVLPGTGHIALGRVGTGVTRLGLFLLWAAASVSFVSQGTAAGVSTLPALPLIFGALVLWVVTAVDVQNLVNGRDRPLLDAQKMLWLVAGVFVATIGAMLPGLFEARGVDADVDDGGPIEIEVSEAPGSTPAPGDGTAPGPAIPGGGSEPATDPAGAPDPGGTGAPG